MKKKRNPKCQIMMRQRISWILMMMSVPGHPEVIAGPRPSFGRIVYKASGYIPANT